MARKHKEDEVLRTLNLKRDLRINPRTKTVQVLENCEGIGNGSWGKIDYLVNHLQYSFFRVEKFYNI